MMQIISTTDGKFVGLIFDPQKPIMLGGTLFRYDKMQSLSVGYFRFSNSNYVIDTKEI